MANGDEYDVETTRRPIEQQRTILILAAGASVSDRLIEALKREFPWIVVEYADRIAAACRPFVHPVVLILVDVMLMRSAEAAATELLNLHPQAHIAILEPYDTVAATSLNDILTSPLVHSVLPMDLRLDVWLSVVRLLLCGGTYFPPGLIRAAYGEQSRPAPVGGGWPQIRQGPTPPLAGLTVRETQILQLVSSGLQNKLIAVECGVSENTVKIHLHHIIRKLGVHNRTQAAARFRTVQEDTRSSLIDEQGPA